MATDHAFVPNGHDDVEGATDVSAEEVCRRDACDRERRAVEAQRTADRIRGASELPLPEAVADHRHRTVGAAAASIVGIGERATDERPHAQRLEERPARPQPVDKLCLSTGGEIEPRELPCGDRVKKLRSLMDLFPNGIAPHTNTAGYSVCDEHKTRRLFHR